MRQAKLRRVSFILLFSFGLSFLFPFQSNAQSGMAVKPGIEMLQADDSGITLRFSLGDYQISKITLDGQVYDRIELADAGRIEESGKPNLPLMAEMIGVPADANFQVTVLSQQSEELPGTYFIEPAGSYASSGEDLSPGMLQYLIDNASYSSSTAYPGKIAELGDAAWLREQKIVPVRLYPFQYRPSERSLSIYTTITIRVDFLYPNGKLMPNQQSSQASGSPSAFESIYKENLLNYDQAKSFRSQAPADDRIKPMMANLNEQSDHPRYKITITEDGIYRITYETLQSIGFPVETIDPQTFSMTNQGRPVAIYVDDSGGDPTKFQPDEFILIYGEHLDGTYLASLYADEADQWRKQFIHPAGAVTNWSPQFNHTMIEKYTNENVYWLDYDGVGGSFMTTQDVTPTEGVTPTSFREKIRFEENNEWRTNHYTSEDTFFWQRVRTTSEISKTYTITAPNPILGDGGILNIELIGYTQSISNPQDHREIFYLNDTQISDEVWDGLISKNFSISVSSSGLLDGLNKIGIKFFNQSGQGNEDILVNWFEIEYNRQFITQDNQLIFTKDPSDNYKFEISGFNTQPYVLDITNSLTPVLLTDSIFNPVTGVLSFQGIQPLNSRYITAVSQDILSANIEAYSPTANLLEPADYIVITHPSFLGASQELADYRLQHDGLVSRVVNIEDLYNEFNFGIYHPIAIKNYLNYVYHHWAKPPTYVLLIGDGHWNFLGSSIYDNPPIFIPPNLSWIDPWQGEVDSSNLLATVNGDDPLPDILIGRLPVTNSDQILNYVDKIQNHENQLEEHWQQHFIFIADQPDPNAGDFPSISEQIIHDYLTVIQQPKWFYLDEVIDENENKYKIYNTDQYSNIRCTNYPDDINPERFCWNATNEIINLLNTDGGGLLTYSGHGAINIWTHFTKLIDNSDIPSLNNSNYLPIILSWTCLDGYWIYPKINPDYTYKNGQSLIEELIRDDDAGSIAAFSPTGLGLSTGHDYLERGFLNYIFSKQTPWRLGDAALAAKLYLFLSEPKYSDGNPRDIDLIHTYTVFGDPALLTSPPQYTLYLPLILK